MWLCECVSSVDRVLLSMKLVPPFLPGAVYFLASSSSSSSSSILCIFSSSFLFLCLFSLVTLKPAFVTFYVPRLLFFFVNPPLPSSPPFAHHRLSLFVSCSTCYAILCYTIPWVSSTWIGDTMCRPMHHYFSLFFKNIYQSLDFYRPTFLPVCLRGRVSVVGIVRAY